MISVKHIKKYLNHLKPYMNAVKNLRPNLESSHMATLYGLENQTELDETRTSEVPTASNFVYLCQAYMSVYGVGTILNSKIHDGWAIARILAWDAENQQVVNYNETTQTFQTVQTAQTTKIFTLNLNESNHTDIDADQLFLVLNRRDHTVGLQLNDETVDCTPCNQFYINLKFNEVDTVIRGDHLSMLIDFKHLTKKQKDRDIKFASYMRKQAVEIASLAGHVFNKPIILPKVKQPKAVKQPKPPKPPKHAKQPMQLGQQRHSKPSKYPQDPRHQQSMPGMPGMPGQPRTPFNSPPTPSGALFQAAGQHPHNNMMHHQYRPQSYIPPHVPYSQVIQGIPGIPPNKYQNRNHKGALPGSGQPTMQTTYPSYPPYQFEAPSQQQLPRLPILPNHLFSP